MRIAIGVDTERYSEIPGVTEIPHEESKGWCNFLRLLRKCRLEQIVMEWSRPRSPESCWKFLLIPGPKNRDLPVAYCRRGKRPLRDYAPESGFALRLSVLSRPPDT